ncbi:MAG: hypothetical protein GQ574_25290 [Crocinitomix sp.]|nr:hypothetical protein [Crocinitomix sp.]
MNYLTMTTLLLALIFAPMSIFAQDEGIDYGTATVTEEYCVSLNTEVPISEYYSIDISHLDITTELEAVNNFGFISNNLLTYSVDFAAEKAYLHVHLDRTSAPKDIIWWNEYVNSLCGL